MCCGFHHKVTLTSALFEHHNYHFTILHIFFQTNPTFSLFHYISKGAKFHDLYGDVPVMVLLAVNALVSEKRECMLRVTKAPNKLLSSDLFLH